MKTSPLQELVPLSGLLALWQLFAGCNGGQQGPPPPAQDFSVSVSPISASAVVGNTTPSVTISITPQNGFTGAVSIALQGIPAGVTAMPGTSLSIDAGANQSVTFSVSSSADVGSSSIGILATSGRLSHSTQVSLTAEAIVSTYQIGSMLYLESGTATDSARIGLETNWGGSIAAVSLNGTDFVNRHDTGREVQSDFFDSNAQYCCGVWGWNPNLGGDVFNQGTPIISYSLTSNSLFTKAQPLQWSPADFGGGQGNPIAGDMLLEQTITAVTSQPHTFKAHYKFTHLGSDLHTNGTLEFPATYTNQAYKNFVYYAGTAPWTNAPETVMQFPAFAYTPVLYIPEHWGALVDSQNIGLTVYVPSQYPFGIGSAVPTVDPGGPSDYSTNYYSPSANLTIGPNFVFEGELYLIAGNYHTARQIVYQLRQNQSPDLFPPLGSIDQPAPGTVLAGTAPVTGWTFDDVNVTKVEVLIDGVPDGTASYGSPRPDVATVFPHAPLNVGYSYSLDTSKYTNGPHTLNVRATDSSGNVAVLPDAAVTISNGVAGAIPSLLIQATQPARNPLARRKIDIPLPLVGPESTPNKE